MYFAYSLLFAVALVLSAPWWLWEMLRHGKYRSGWGQRLGQVPDRLTGGQRGETIWIHAVSVGEVLAISRVVEELKAALPGWRFVVSTTTDTGQRLARQRFGESDVFYCPLDLPFAVRTYLRTLQPRLLVLAESEFWPNLLHEAHSAGAAVAVVNARVSDRSLPRYLRFRKPLARVMQNAKLFLAQSQEDARRLVRIGAPSERVEVGGNLKFEVKPDGYSEIVERVSNAIHHEAAGPVIVAGSTLEGEEEMLVEAFRQIMERYPKALLLLAPRHPERFTEVATLLRQTEVPWQRRSQWERQPVAGGVLLLDTIGELAGLYQLADLAFIGGSLVPRGGHNVLEAAQFGVAILVGPHTENFRDVIGILREAGGLRVVTRDTLASAMLDLLQDDAARSRLGTNALDTLRSQQGATQRTADALLGLLQFNSTAPAMASETRR